MNEIENEIENEKQQSECATGIFRKAARKMVEHGVDPDAVIVALLNTGVVEIVEQKGINYAAQWLREAADGLEQNNGEKSH